MTSAEIHVGEEEPDHSPAIGKQTSQDIEQALSTQHEHHVPQTQDVAAPSLVSDAVAVDADNEDFDGHKIGIAVACPAQNDNIGAE